MKITKKILAGTLALMNVFTVLSAEPIEIEKSPDTSTSKKNKEVKLKRKIFGKILTAALFSVIGFSGVVKLLSKDDKVSDSKYEEEYFVVNEPLDQVFYYCSVPKVREYIERNAQEADFIYLFNVLKGIEQVDGRRVETALKYVEDQLRDYMFGVENKLLSGVSEIEDMYVYRKNFSNQIGYNMSGVDDTHDTVIFCLGKNSYPFDKKFSHCLKKAELVYDLTSIIVHNENDFPFTSLYINYENGNWYRCSFNSNNGEKVSEKEIFSKFLNSTQYIDLVYTKRQ